MFKEIGEVISKLGQAIEQLSEIDADPKEKRLQLSATVVQLIEEGDDVIPAVIAFVGKGSYWGVLVAEAAKQLLDNPDMDAKQKQVLAEPIAQVAYDGWSAYSTFLKRLFGKA